jgi:hypothetical protein
MSTRVYYSIAALALAFSFFIVPSETIAKGSQKQLSMKGVLHAIEDGVLLLSVKISKQTASQLSKAGYQRISSDKDIAGRTILKDRLFLAYTLGKRAPSAKSLRRKIGARVNLKLRRFAGNHAIVVGVK